VITTKLGIQVLKYILIVKYKIMHLLQFCKIITDIDECLEYNDCHQMCLNTDGSYQCNCNTGFVLTVDNRTCEGNCNYCEIHKYNT